jgi:hypothetical protein
MLTAHWFDRAIECDSTLWKEGFPPSIEGKWWYEALEYARLEDQFSFLYLELRNTQNEAIALAPCFVMDMPLEMVAPEPLVPLLKVIAKLYPPLLHQRTFFVGSPCSDKGWIGLSPKIEPPEIEQIFRSLHQAMLEKAHALQAPMRVWKDMPEQFDKVLKAISAEYQLFPVVSFPGTEVTLPDTVISPINKGKKNKSNPEIQHLERHDSLLKEAYFAGIKPSRRQKLRRTLRRAETANPLRIDVVQFPSTELLDQLFDLFWQTYENATTRFEKLNRSFFESIAQCESCRFIVLYPAANSESHLVLATAPHASPRLLFDSTVPVAFMLVYVDGSILINKFIGINYSAPKEWFLYFRLWDACVDLAIQGGHRAIESGQTGYDAKISVGHHMIPLTHYCHHSNPVLRLIYALVGKQVTWESLDPELARLGKDRAD